MIHVLIQILALPILLAILVANLRNRLVVRLMLLGEAIAPTLLAILPGAARMTAARLGCQSPMAPIVYLLVLFCLSVSLVVLVTFRRQSDRLTEVIRTLALRNAESMDTGNTP